MFSIQKEIEKVILDQDFVVLPGIGGFLSEYTKPYYDANGEIVLPEKKIVFNSIIDKDLDQKLINILQKNLRIPADFAITEYNNFLRNFRSELILNKKFNWEGLGLFYKSSSGEIDFYPEIEIKKPVFETISKVEEEIINKYEPVFESEEVEYKPKKTWSFPRILLYLIPIFMLSSGLAYTIFFKPSQNKVEKKSLVDEIDSLSMIQQQTMTDTSAEPRIVADDETKKENQEKSGIKEPKNGNQSNKEHIISIGVFKNKENVDNLASYLAENGLPVRVRNNGGNIKIFIVANSEEQALEFVEKIEQLTGEKPVYENNN